MACGTPQWRATPVDGRRSDAEYSPTLFRRRLPAAYRRAPAPPLAIPVVLVTILAVACSSTSPSTTGPAPVDTPNAWASAFAPALPPGLNADTLPPCVNPDPVDTPDWVPADLPLPEGTYTSVDAGAVAGYQMALFVVPGELGDLAGFILEEWPKAGYLLRRPDSEAGEIDANFVRAPAVGALRARSVLCKPGYSLMTVLYLGDRVDVQTPPSVVPSVPGLGPSAGPIIPSPTG